MKKAPTLFDTVYQTTFKKGISGEFLELRKAIQSARRFVLDDGMSSFMADLGWTAYLSIRNQTNRFTIADNVRELSRLPHAVTWVEWNEKMLAQRAHSIYPSSLDPEKVPTTVGWLLIQHPGIETAFMGLNFAMGHTNFGAEGVDSLGISPFAFCWRTDDGVVPWPVQPEADSFLGLHKASMAAIMMGLGHYQCEQLKICSPAPYLTNTYCSMYKAVEIRNMVREQVGMMRYIFGLLSTINDLPISTKVVTQSKGFVARGNYRRFLDHSVITLTVPATRHVALARKVVGMLRRRAHSVRGHWRDDWRHPGQKVWIREHQRGNASLGYVTHDYSVPKKLIEIILKPP